MIRRVAPALAAAFLFLAPATSHAALAAYTQNFETLVKTDPGALAADGWVIYGNVYSPANAYLYGYGTFPAPNGTSNFCSIDAGQGGVDQGLQQLSIYSDYNNADHAIGNLIESNVFHEQTIGAGNVGTQWTFQFDAKLGNLVAPTTALAFIKTLDPNNNYATTNFLKVNTTAIPSTWSTYSIAITITPALVGQLLQFGFASTASFYVSSGVFYDNINFTKTGALDVAGGPLSNRLELRAGSPNPFSTSTRIGFSLAQRGTAEVGVYDIGGRRVAELFKGTAEAGPHSTSWDGRMAGGQLAPTGVYQCILHTATGTQASSLVLNR